MKAFKNLLFLTCFVFSSLSIAAGALTDKQKINKLLDEIETSNLIFIRNGSEYSSAKARKHLEYKYNYVTKGFWFWQKKQKVTVRAFIDKLASQSSTSGKIYFIQTKEGTKVPARDWLNKRLKLIESNQ